MKSYHSIETISIPQIPTPTNQNIITSMGTTNNNNHETNNSSTASHPILSLTHKNNDPKKRDQTVHLGVIETIMGDLSELTNDMSEANIYDMRKHNLSNWSSSLGRSLTTLASAIRGALHEGDKAIEDLNRIERERDEMKLMLDALSGENKSSDEIFGAVTEKSINVDPHQCQNNNNRLHDNVPLRVEDVVHDDTNDSAAAAGGEGITSDTDENGSPSTARRRNGTMNNNNTTMSGRNRTQNKDGTMSYRKRIIAGAAPVRTSPIPSLQFQNQQQQQQLSPNTNNNNLSHHHSSSMRLGTSKKNLSSPVSNPSPTNKVQDDNNNNATTNSNASGSRSRTNSFLNLVDQQPLALSPSSLNNSNRITPQNSFLGVVNNNNNNNNNSNSNLIQSPTRNNSSNLPQAGRRATHGKMSARSLSNTTNNVNNTNTSTTPTGNNNNGLITTYNNNNNSSSIPLSLTSYVSGSVYLILDSLLASLDCSWCSCFLHQARSNELVLVSSVGTRRDQKPGTLRLSSTSGIESLVLSTGIGMNITHAYSEDEFNPKQDQLLDHQHHQQNRKEVGNNKNGNNNNSVSSPSSKANNNSSEHHQNQHQQKKKQSSSSKIERTRSELVFPLIRPGLDGSNWGSHCLGVVQCCNKRRASTVNLGVPDLSFQEDYSASSSMTNTNVNFTAEDEHRITEACHIMSMILARHPCDISSPLLFDAGHFLSKNPTLSTHNRSDDLNSVNAGGKGIFIQNPALNNNNNNNNNTRKHTTSFIMNSPNSNNGATTTGRRSPQSLDKRFDSLLSFTSNNNNNNQQQHQNTNNSDSNTALLSSPNANNSKNNNSNGAAVSTGQLGDALLINPGSRHPQLVYRTSKAGHVKRTELLSGAMALPAVATITDAMEQVATVNSGWKNAVMLNVELEHEVSKFKDQIRSLQRENARLQSNLAEKFIGSATNGGSNNNNNNNNNMNASGMNNSMMTVGSFRK